MQKLEETKQINAELIGAQGKPQDIGGYYQPNPELTNKCVLAQHSMLFS
jgi:isocitrate dehydrogenase